eukprot:7471986-Pyramimonas_sp.AAC.1
MIQKPDIWQLGQNQGVHSAAIFGPWSPESGAKAVRKLLGMKTCPRKSGSRGAGAHVSTKSRRRR